MNGDLVATLIASVFALFFTFLLFAWIFRRVAAWLCIYSDFVLELPYIISIPAFIIFPPTFVAFLAGLVFLRIGGVDDGGVWKFDARLSKLSNRAEEKRKRRRRELGYDDD